MTAYIVRCLLQAIPTFLGITIIAYAVIRLARRASPLAVFEDARGTTAEQMAAAAGARTASISPLPNPVPGMARPGGPA